MVGGRRGGRKRRRRWAKEEGREVGGITEGERGCVKG